MLQTLAASCRENGTKLLLAKVPIKAEFDGTYDTEEHDPGKITEMLEQISRQNSIPLLNLNDRLAAEDDPLKVFMRWEYHFNETGHEFVAKHLTDFLQFQDQPH